jgi:hypothetical protein
LEAVSGKGFEGTTSVKPEGGALAEGVPAKGLETEGEICATQRPSERSISRDPSNLNL